MITDRSTFAAVCPVNRLRHRGVAETPLARDIPPSSTSPAEASASSYTWPYTRSVIAGSWPSHFAVADTVVPLSSIRVAAVCLVSCNRITVKPAALQWRRNALEYVSGRIGEPSSLIAMSPVSIHVAPSTTLSRFCCAFSIRNAAMTSAGIGSVRRERSDFGAPVVVPEPRTTTRPWATLTVQRRNPPLTTPDRALRNVARRLDDNTLGAFAGDYVRDHITYGYAVTVHSAQGATADVTHAVLSETANRALCYVAMTRGRQFNTAYLYQRGPEHEYPRGSAVARNVLPRGSRQRAGRLLRLILANDERPLTAHDGAERTSQDLPHARAANMIECRAAAIRSRVSTYKRWRAASIASVSASREARGLDIGSDRSSDHGLEF
jgi:hypothetical protein